MVTPDETRSLPVGFSHAEDLEFPYTQASLSHSRPHNQDQLNAAGFIHPRAQLSHGQARTRRLQSMRCPSIRLVCERRHPDLLVCCGPWRHTSPAKGLELISDAGRQSSAKGAAADGNTGTSGPLMDFVTYAWRERSV